MTADRLRLSGTDLDFYPITSLPETSGLPMTVKVLLEGMLRLSEVGTTNEKSVRALAAWPAKPPSDAELPFLPARVLMQDFTGVPAVVDLAAMRSAMKRAGKDAGRVDPLVPVDLIIDHSVQVDSFGLRDSYTRNIEREIERNHERYALLRWAQQAFNNFSLVPPGMGICHQVNLEYVAKVVQVRDAAKGRKLAIPDTLMGTDSHTTMVNGLGVLGWGVGGIEAEAAMLGQPAYLATPVIVGVRFHGALPAGSTATDLVLTLTVPDRATLSNMCPEYGATSALFPVDAQTLRYLEVTGRPREQIELVERYTKEQGLFRVDGSATPKFSELLELDLTKVEPSLAGPKRPQDRAPLPRVWESFTAAFGNGPHPDADALSRLSEEGGPVNGRAATAVAAKPAKTLDNGCVVIAAITSCTNTSNPSVMVAAGLLAKKAVDLGLAVAPFVKTSLAPGSRVVTDYLQTAGLMEPLEKASYLGSPPLVVAYALAGTVNIDLTKDPVGKSPDGKPVMLSELWPSQAEVNDVVQKCVRQDMFKREYSRIFDGDEHWKQMTAPTGPIFDWDPDSTYVKEPPYFEDFAATPKVLTDVVGARVIAVLGDSVTTDHISPAGAIPADSPAGKYLVEHGVQKLDFNSYGSRRGNHEVMVRGTFGNIRLRNKLVEREGYWTRHFPGGEEATIYDASERYRAENVPVIIIAGKEYGSGSSRDWAAKGPLLLGVRAVIAESFERIHRSNLVGMGVLPLEFGPGENPKTLGLTGHESFTIRGLDGLVPGQPVDVVAATDDGKSTTFTTRARVDNDTEIGYMHNGGILPQVLRELMG